MKLVESEVGFAEPVLYSDPEAAIERLYIDAHAEHRAFTGIEPFDREMRGISAGQLALVVGYAHAGKTLVALHVIANNRDRRVVLFTPDETAPLVWIKLACMVWGVSGAEMEARVVDEDPWARRALHTTMEMFPHLMVFDRPLTPRLMTDGYSQVCDRWGAGAELAVVDYLDLLTAGDLAGRAEYVKNWGSRHEVPLIVLHQTSRSAGARGQAMRIDSGNFGGETYATYQLGVWRKEAAISFELDDLRGRVHQTEYIQDRIAWLQHELEVHRYTVTIGLNKNKRPSGRRLDGIDFELDLETGCLSMLEPGSLPDQYRHRGLRAVASEASRSVR